MKPATPLPWRVEYVAARPQVAPEVASLMLNRECDDNARYIVRACNAYPELVSAIRRLVHPAADDSDVADAIALLSKLAE